jgi:toxin ParE1/3/4
MAQIIWTYTAQVEFEAITNFTAFDDPVAARRFAAKVMRAVKNLERFPRIGPRIPELRNSQFRQLVVRPCRIFYRIAGKQIIIQYIMRKERLFRREYLS